MAQRPSTLDALEVGEVGLAAGGGGPPGVGEVVAELPGVEVVVAGDRDQGVAGHQLGDEPAEGGVEGLAPAGGVGEQGAAAGGEVAAEGGLVLLGELDGRPAVEVDQG